MASLNPYAAMSLAAITYDDQAGPLPQQRDAMRHGLAALAPAAAGPWSLAWGPIVNDGILAFVALNAAGTQYAVAIRGSLSDRDAPGFFANWFDDFDAFAQVPWLYPQAAGGAAISSGMNSALCLLLGATDPATDLCLLDYLRSVLGSARDGVMVTGHSLGGALTSLVAAWLRDQLPKASGPAGVAIAPYTFAAPTAGNLAFAQQYDLAFPAAYRCVNTRDIVPMGYADLAGIQALYPRPGQRLSAYSHMLWGAVEMARIYMAAKGIVYSQTNLAGVGTTDAFAGPAPSAESFTAEAEAQHDHNLYLAHVTPP